MEKALRDPALLVARVAVGIVLVAHGWQKFDEFGVSNVAKGFDKGGVPLPELAAYYATFVELIGGGLLIAGAATPLVALLIAGDMLGAFLTMHWGTEVFVGNGGFELVWVIGAAALLFAVFGAGRISVDEVIRQVYTRRKRV